MYTVAFDRLGGFCIVVIVSSSNDSLASIGRIHNPPGPIVLPVSTFSLSYHTSHSFSLNTTSHPPPHNPFLDTSDEWLRKGTICPFLDSFGRPGILR